MDIVLSYVQGIIEVLGSIALALVFSRVRIKWVKTTLTAAVIAAVMIGIRNLPVVFGIHMVAGIIMTFIFIISVTTADKSRAFIAVFASFLVLGVIEYSISWMLFRLNLLHIEDVGEVRSLWMLEGYIQAVLMNIIAVVLQIFLRPVYDWKNDNGT